jgi:hypothetical protein
MILMKMLKDYTTEGYIMPKRQRFGEELRNCSIKVRHPYHGESYLESEGNSLLYKPAEYRDAVHLNCISILDFRS